MNLKILALTMLVASSYTSQAQEKGTPPEMQTLLGDRAITTGWTAAMRISYSQFNGTDAWWVGGRGGGIFNRVLVIGGGGYGLVNSPFQPNVNGDGVYTESGYGGMYLEAILWPHKLVHISIPVIIGGGAISYIHQRSITRTHYPLDENIFATSTFFVFEPGMDIELNVVRSFRLAIGASYRHTSPIALPGTPANALRGFTASITLKFGNF